MWFYEQSLISKKPYDPFYYIVSAFTFFFFRNGKLHLAKEIYNHAPTHVVGPKLQYLRKYCHSSILFPPSTSAPKPQTRRGSNVLAVARKAFWFFRECSWKFFFKEVNICGFPWVLAVSGTINISFFPLYLKTTYFFQVVADGNMIYVSYTLPKC